MQQAIKKYLFHSLAVLVVLAVSLYQTALTPSPKKKQNKTTLNTKTAFGGIGFGFSLERCSRKFTECKTVIYSLVCFYSALCNKAWNVCVGKISGF